MEGSVLELQNAWDSAGISACSLHAVRFKSRPEPTMGIQGFERRDHL